MVTQSGTNALHGSLFEFLRNSALDSRSVFAQTPHVPPFRQNQFGGALGGPLKKDRLFLFGNYEGFRQAQTLSSVSVVPDAQVRQGAFPNAAGVYAPVANLNRSMLPYFSFWPQANGPELLSNGLPSGTAFSYNNPKQTIREDFGTVRSDYTIRDRDTLSATYTIDDGNSLIPLADPLFGSYSRATNAGGQRAGNPYLLAANVEYLPRRLLPCGIQSGFGSVGLVSAPISLLWRAAGPEGSWSMAV